MTKKYAFLQNGLDFDSQNQPSCITRSMVYETDPLHGYIKGSKITE